MTKVRKGAKPAEPQDGHTLGVAILCGVIGAALMAGGVISLWKYWQGRSSASWPTTPARLTDGSVTTYKKKGGQLRHVAKVAYTYSVDGQSYTGSRFNTSDNELDETTAETFRSAYQVGGTYPVTYDPADPASSFLQPGGGGSTGQQLFMGVGGLVLGGLMVGYGVYGRQTNGTPKDTNP